MVSYLKIVTLPTHHTKLKKVFIKTARFLHDTNNALQESQKDKMV